ncbi:MULTISPECIES: thioredoxin [unclassified Breznakia]|uniref:thioredoxin n=1 Tax=unclassified Breznakia TaxID=2623764 RepID=UPI0024758307|nr:MULTISPECIES: thioredoxin [unclassified Breznakia]MDH6368125.1 thioredoxin 1 [Breznakia sp. PH1-1]MDH6405214.1 thioredoxin 1 [Breznakia sp. PF1-11]MDH6412933.1 thioredoxin 1 [Breznakia sp. PFB1-11]MDH6415295.1 thioredoxin 1 [Breznakia sp. PFB1-14]MDH6417599.1 thioredoxin 1 [Breznakia sp. PFB1-4]
MKIVSGSDFEKEIEQGLVLVDFYADWCGPCKMQAPVLEEVQNELQDQVKIIKLNVDNDPAIAQNYNVMSIPTLVLFKNGTEFATTVGFQAKPQLIEFINKGK